MEQKRIEKVNYYLDIAEAVGARGTCLRANYGSVIVNRDEVISTGYTGAARGKSNCIDLGYCIRRKLEPNSSGGARFDLCRSVHSEQNAIISAARKDMLESSLYIVGKYYNSEKYNKGMEGQYVKTPDCCQFCKRMIINAGIEKVYFRVSKEEYRVTNVQDWIESDELLEGNIRL